ncbi:MAG TPA: ribonuclease H-like YkuK family protein [Syntrophomonadaceae bacterium]|jgi:predicted RNase H-related nuclease YkuK (DUF458 family)|nr:hypothetical protein [Syntrophomonadaceae bacterium]HOQ10133.1 ribonuclease H-like YkuK family protein [Syntrophomonadaceae bacterium]HPU49266.1 ribonuclease H-like YkuK family protein [Syntrophomonadaceae bacterium]
MQFISPSRGSMTLEQVVADILAYISEDQERSYTLLVGTDSQPYHKGTCFVSAIIIHRKGKGARYYYNKTFETKIYSLRQRIFYEASLSLALSDQLYNCLKEQGHEELTVEVHLDVGTHGETKELVKEVTGMIVGSGFDARIKPNAYAASKVADKHTK